MRKGTLLFSILTMFFLGSCSKDAGEPELLSINSVAVSNASNKLTTGSIGVFLTQENGYTPANNVEYKYSNGAWNAASPILLDKAKAGLSAYCPYSSSITDAKAIPLKSQFYTEKEDICYSSTHSMRRDSVQWDMVMSHAYSLLIFTIIRDASYKGNCAITNIKIANAGICSSGTVDITTGTYSTQASGSIECDPKISGLLTTQYATIGILAVPVLNAMSGNIAVTFTIDGAKLPDSIDPTVLSMTMLLPNVFYNVPIKISGTQISIGQVSTNDWNKIQIPGSNVLQPEPI